MTKKKETALVPEVEKTTVLENAPAVKNSTAVALITQPSTELIERMADTQDNLESVESFQLPRVGMSAAGFILIEGEPAIMELEGVLVYIKKTNTYYEKPYNPSVKAEPPTCFSLDGTRPDESIKNPQHKTCSGCPKAEYGTNAFQKGKACRNLKPLFLLLGDGAIMPRQLNVTPTSLKAANQYLLNLTERGYSYRSVVTKLKLYKENPLDTYFKISFSMGKKLDAQETFNAKWLRDKWLPVMDKQIGDILDNAESAPAGQQNAAPEQKPETAKEFSPSGY